MSQEDIVKEGARFFTLVPMKMLCNIIMENAHSRVNSNFRHPELVEISQDEIFTIDCVWDEEVFCDFDNHDELCEKYVPAHMRESTGTLLFVTCEFVAGKIDVIKLCEHIGFEEEPSEYDGPIIL